MPCRNVGRTGVGEYRACEELLTIPLAPLLGLAERPGEAHGLGVLDPGLARRLAAEAARNPRSEFRIVVTDEDGQATGFGLAIRRRSPEAARPPQSRLGEPGPPRDGSPMPAVTFSRAGAGPDGGYGSWTLTIGDAMFTVKLLPIPQGECDHRYESAGYHPSETLRWLVQIRDGECTMPVCVRHPRGCDWEHAVPWPAERTCNCNGGARCRHDHLIKQDPRWSVRQLPGGYHQWTTPSGLSYTKGPKQYPT
jgi:hypothetical protein